MIDGWVRVVLTSVFQGGILAPLGCRVIITEVQQDERQASQVSDKEKEAMKVTEKLVDISE